MPTALRQIRCAYRSAPQRAIGGRCARLRGADRRGYSLCKTMTRQAGQVCSIGAGCEFSRMQTLLTLAIVEAKSGSRVWCRQKNTRHAEVVCRMACARALPVLLVHSRDVRTVYAC